MRKKKAGLSIIIFIIVFDISRGANTAVGINAITNVKDYGYYV